MAGANVWKRCSSCKKEIHFASTYYVCSVSTCTKKRTGFAFCSVECWETHLPLMRHREAWAVEETAPTAREWAEQQASEGGAPVGGEDKPDKPATAAPQRRRVVGTKAYDTPAGAPVEVLVIASRLKHYIREVHGLNTSDAVMDVLSEHLRQLANRAAEAAKEAERKTVLDRDLDFLAGAMASLR